MQVLRDSRDTRKEYAVVLSCKETEKIAKEIVSLAPDHLRHGSITWDSFEDGFPNIMINQVESIRGRDCVFVCSFLNPSALLARLSVLYSLPRYSVKSLIVITPYFPTGTMERVDEEGQVATAMTMARLLSATPLTQGGPVKLMIYDIHALQNRFYFGDGVIPLLVSAIPLFLDALRKYHADEKIVIAFPDDGANKRFGKMFKEYPIVICAKVRQGNKRIVTVKEGSELITAESHVFIVDDLVKTGGTLLECKQALLSLNAAKCSCYVTHAVFPQLSWKRFVHNNNTTTPTPSSSSSPSADPSPFTKFYVTNSCPDVTDVISAFAPFHVLDLAPHILESILKY